MIVCSGLPDWYKSKFEHKFSLSKYDICTISYVVLLKRFMSKIPNNALLTTSRAISYFRDDLCLWEVWQLLRKSYCSTPSYHNIYMISWIPWNLSVHYISFHVKILQTMLWHHSARAIHTKDESKLRFSVCFHLWCELTTTMNVTEWQVSWNSYKGAGSVLGQGGRIARKGHPRRRERIAAIARKRHFVIFCYLFCCC